MKREFDFRELLGSAISQMRIKLAERLLPSPGELGIGREEVLRQFFRDFLPQRFGVSTGFVFDSVGNISRQIDIVIYDKQVCPNLQSGGGRRLFPCESVVCVGEVKSRLDSVDRVRDALENLRSVKVLDRSALGSNISYQHGWEIDQHSDHLDQIFAFVFVVTDCVSEASVIKAWYELLWENKRPNWPNVLFCLDKMLVTYSCESGVCPNPMDALAFSAITDVSPDKLFARFFSMVARAVEVTATSSVPWWNLLNDGGGVPINYFSFKDAPVKPPIPDHLLKRPGIDD